MDEEVLFRHAAKPGYQSREQAERAAFTSELIKALQDADARRRGSDDQQQLASAAFDKLQYDFPLVSGEELGALIESHKLRGGYPLTPKYLAVVREGASAAAAGPTSADAGTAAPAADSGSSSDSGLSRPEAPDAAAAAPPADPHVPLYQQLYAVILLKTLQRALGEWDAATCSHHLNQLLASLPAQQAATSAGQSLGPEAAGATEGEQEVGALGALGMLGSRAGAAARNEAAAAIPQDTPAQREDSDDLAYEPLEQPPPPSRSRRAVQQHGSSRSSGGSGGMVWQQEQHLLPTLCHLAGQLSWHCLSGDSLWQDQGLMQEVAACLKQVRQHKSFPELSEGVAEPLLRLVVARVGSCQADVGRFGSILDSLGMAEGGTPDPEASRLALSAAAMLARQLSSPPAQRKLWQEMHTSLLPLAAQQLEGVQTTLAKRAKQGANGAAAARTGPSAPAVLPSKGELYRLIAACQLLYFYVLHAPHAVLQGTRLQDALLAGGLFRALVLLFVRLAALPQAESLRCALLLCCTASAGLLQWATAVPGFSAAALSLRCSQLPQQPPQEEQQRHNNNQQQEGGKLEGGGGSEPSMAECLAVHGALWSLLLEKGPQAAQLLVELLEGAAAAPLEEAVRAMGLLQLMAAVQQVSRPRYPWPASVEAALRQLAAAFKEGGRQARLAAEGPQGEQPHANGGRAEEEGVKGAPGQQQEEGQQQQQQQQGPAGGGLLPDGEEEGKLRVPMGDQVQVLAARRAAQLQPLCLKLLKDLLQKQGAPGKHD